MLNRNKLYQLINIAKNQLGLDDELYRAILVKFGSKVKNGRISATTMNLDQLNDVLNYFKSNGFTIKSRVKSNYQKSTNKLEYAKYLLKRLNRPKNYGDSLAWKIFGVMPLNLLTDYQLNKIIKSLRLQCEREGVL